MKFGDVAENLALVTGGKRHFMTQDELQALGPVKTILHQFSDYSSALDATKPTVPEQTSARSRVGKPRHGAVTPPQHATESPHDAQADNTTAGTEGCRDHLAAADGTTSVSAHRRHSLRMHLTTAVTNVASKEDLLRHVEKHGDQLLLNCFVDVELLLRQSPSSHGSGAAGSGRRAVAVVRQEPTTASGPVMLTKLLGGAQCVSSVISSLYTHALSVAMSAGCGGAGREAAAPSPYKRCAMTLCRRGSGAAVGRTFVLDDVLDIETVAAALILADLALAVALPDGTPVIPLGKFAKAKNRDTENRTAKHQRQQSSREHVSRPSESVVSIATALVQQEAANRHLLVSSKPLLRIMTSLRQPKRPLKELPRPIMEALLAPTPPFNLALYLPQATSALRLAMADEGEARESVETEEFVPRVTFFNLYWKLLGSDAAARAGWWRAQTETFEALCVERATSRVASEIAALTRLETAGRGQICAMEHAATTSTLHCALECLHFSVIVLLRREADVEKAEISARDSLTSAAALNRDELRLRAATMTYIGEMCEAWKAAEVAAYAEKRRLLHSTLTSVCRRCAPVLVQESLQ